MNANYHTEDIQSHPQTKEHCLRIRAVEHLIDEQFDSPMLCHEVCLLVTQLFGDSHDDVSRQLAELANKALESTVEFQSLN